MFLVETKISPEKKIKQSKRKANPMFRMLRYFIPFLIPEITEIVEIAVIERIIVICKDRLASKEKLYSMPLVICIAPRPSDIATPITGQTTAEELRSLPKSP